MFNALSNVVPSHLMDASLFPFAGLRATGQADPLGDIAFDDEPCATTASGEGGGDGGAQTISFVPFDED
jgi:tRNA 2-thiocytidine biosynthesis protein TtcA